jgi:hypothetical protein
MSYRHNGRCRDQHLIGIGPAVQTNMSTTRHRRVPLRHSRPASPRKSRGMGYASIASAPDTSTLTCMPAAESRDGWARQRLDPHGKRRPA